MSLPGEALFGVTGLDQRRPVSEADRDRAMKMPARWQGKIKAFFSEKYEDFEMPPEIDVMATWDKLALGPSEEDQRLRVSSMTSDDIQQDYLLTWSNAVAYLRDKWPVSMVESPLGEPKQLPPSPMQALFARSLYASVDNPERVVDELLQAVLTSETVDAVSTVYPALTDMLRGLVTQEMTARLARSKTWEPSQKQDQLLRILLGVPQGTQIAEVQTADGESRETRPPRAPEIKIAENFQTKSQELSTQ